MPDVIDRFLMQAGTQPNTHAIVDDKRIVTYGELESLAQRIVALLAGTMQHPKVLIMLPQSAEAYASMIGTLMAGGYYCPINISLPRIRKIQIIEQFDPHVIIGTFSDLEIIQKTNTSSVFLNINDLPSHKITSPQSPHELGYVIFTSGSTGQPKGVMIRRTAISHFISWAIETTKVGPDDYWGQFSNLGFDLSVMDIYATLGSGATLVPLVGAKDRLMPAAAIAKYGLTIWHSVPSVIDMMNQANQINAKTLKSLRLMSFCGELLRPQLLELLWFSGNCRGELMFYAKYKKSLLPLHYIWRWFRATLRKTTGIPKEPLLFNANSDMIVFNTYGPTETTLFCTYLSLTKQSFRTACDISVAIGEAIPGWRIDLVGGHNSDEGEIVISGDHIGVGYWHNISATEAAFREIVIDGRPRRAYYTGDWAERRQDHLFFRQRIDRQVKIRGFRIELDEIDYFIRDFGVPNSCSMVFQERIYSFLESKIPVDEDRLRKFLSERLPYYTVPYKFITKAQLPRNPNEKVDVKSLLQSLEDSSNYDF